MSEVIVITSGKGGVGKTTTVANIGTGLAMLGKKVVVVETAYANTLDNLYQKTNAVTATEEAAAGYKASQDGQ